MIHTNFLKYSSSFTNWNQYRVETLIGQLALDGSNTALQVKPTFTIGQHYIHTTAAQSGNVLSIFVQSDKPNMFGLSQGNGESQSIIFDLHKQSVSRVNGGTGAVTYIGGNWFRLEYFSNIQSSEFYIWPNGRLNNYSGGIPINIWGAQLENGTAASPYSPRLIVAD